VTLSARAEKPVRVARVATSITINTIMRTQLAAMQAAGLSVACVCDEDEWTDDVRALGVDVIPLGMGRRPNPLQALLWAARFYRILRREKVDIAHTHNAFHGLLGRPVAKLAGVPVVVQTIHNWWYLEPPSSLRARVYLLLERFAARFSDAVLFINHDDVSRAQQARIVKPERIYFIGNGIDTRALEERLSARSREDERARLGFTPLDVAILMVARLEHPKDHDTLLRAYARLAGEWPRTRLLLAGQGLEEQNVRALAESLGIADRTTFLGHVPDVSGLLKASDVLVLASHCEGFGRCLVEAMVAGLPVIGSDVPGIRDVIVNEQTGLLVPPRDVESLHSALSRLVVDASARSRLGEAGREAAVRDFDEALPAQRVLEVYRTLLAAKRGAAETTPVTVL
jgi:glycosyltransferase involved in cell wall biosynthesis